jgi:hypothetical protein
MGRPMRTRVIIEYASLPGDRVDLREREEQRWITSEVVLALPGSATVKVEVLEGPNDEKVRHRRPLMPVI